MSQSSWSRLPEGSRLRTILNEATSSFQELGPIVERNLQTVLKNKEYLRFLEKEYDGCPRTIHSEDSLKYQLEIGEILDDILKIVHQWILGIFVEINISRSQQWSFEVMVIESWINAVLLGYTDEENPGTSLRSLLHCFELQPVYSDGLLRLSMTSSGIFCDLENFDFSRSVQFAPGVVFSFEFPMRSPRLALMGLPVRPQFLCRVAGLREDHVDASVPQNDAEILFWLRLIQREVCLLTEEWEFENAALAHVFMSARADKSRIETMARGRDSLAIYICSSLVELSDFVCRVEDSKNSRIDLQAEDQNEVSNQNGAEDIEAEAAAAHAVLLAALQKIFLPASVSRHDYHLALAACVSDFAHMRLGINSQDFAMRLMFIAAELALPSLEGNASAVENCAKLVDDSEKISTLKWHFSHDPSPSIKAFSWAFRTQDFLLLVLVFASLVMKRHSIRGKLLDENWSSILLSTLQMPSTFPPTRHQKWERRGELSQFVVDDSRNLYRKLAIQSRNWFSDRLLPGMNRSYQAVWNDTLDEYLEAVSLNLSD